MDRPLGGFRGGTRRSGGGAARLGCQAPPVEQNKTALLIANAGCDHLPRLRTPLQEARQLGAALKRIGFEVQMLTDGSEVARDGLFTPALLRYIEEPGIEITAMLRNVRRDVLEASGGKQRTANYDQLVTDVYLAGGTR